MEVFYVWWPLSGLAILSYQIWWCGGARNFVDAAAGDNFQKGVVPSEAFNLILIINIIVAGFGGLMTLLFFLGLPARKK